MENFSIEEIRLQLIRGNQVIAGKWWGSKQKRPILLVHGWQDNAGTFDALIPLLPPEFSYLAIDLPGHGYSSHIPNGCFYHIDDMISILEEIRTMFKWKKLSLIGHSMGVVLAFMYGTLFPSRVDLICALDVLRPGSLDATFLAEIISFRMKKLYSLKNDVKSPEYTYNEMKEIFFKGSLKSLNHNKVEYLMRRGITSSPNSPDKFQLTRDIRVKFINPLTIEHDITMCFIKEIQAAYLCIKSNYPRYQEQPHLFRAALDQFQKYNRNFEIVRVVGTHHFHLNKPDKIAPKIAEFLLKFHQNEANSFDEMQINSKL